MSRANNQKLKLYRLKDIMLKKTDEAHALTMPQILEELEKCEVSAERKSIYTDLELLEELGVEITGNRVIPGLTMALALKRLERVVS